MLKHVVRHASKKARFSLSTEKRALIDRTRFLRKESGYEVPFVGSLFLTFLSVFPSVSFETAKPLLACAVLTTAAGINSGRIYKAYNRTITRIIEADEGSPELTEIDMKLTILEETGITRENSQ